MLRYLTIISFSVIVFKCQAQTNTPSKELVFEDDKGVIRWRANKKEIALFGANYCLPSACDYRAAGYLNADRKRMVDEDMQHFSRMGWDALRLGFWGDYENSDSLGNLVQNDHLDLMDYLISKASQRGIYLLLSPIITYGSSWPDAMNNAGDVHGFSTHFKKSELGTNPKAIAAQVNYIRQLLNHINPYTNRYIKDEPNILMVEMINEPWHHSDDLTGSVNYINALVNAVRSTGCNKIVLHNYSQDFRMAKALQKSAIQGLTFAWYPTGLNSGNTLKGNYLPVVDHYSEEMLRSEISNLARVVYEFDTPDLLTGYLYPAMARSFREVGAQWASMFSYDMLETAPFNLGWQTHCLNMVYTPSKAISAMIAAEVMKEIPRFKNYGNYPTNTSFGNIKVDYDKDLGELISPDKYYYSNNTGTMPIDLLSLNHIAGYGSSPVVQYDGKGIYFLDKINAGVWRLELYPDAVIINDPFNMPSPDKRVFRCLYHNWSMKINLPGLGDNFSVFPLNRDNDYTTSSVNSRFEIHPGVYILSSGRDLKKLVLPDSIGRIGIREFYTPKDTILPVQLVIDYHTEFESGTVASIEAEVYSEKKIENVSLFIREMGKRSFLRIPMKNNGGYKYSGEVPTGTVSMPGWIEYCIVVKENGETFNFPGGSHTGPDDWNFSGSATWTSKLVNHESPLQLIDPKEDINKIAFTRIGDDIRFGIFRIVPASDNGSPAFRLMLPYKYDSLLKDYTLSVSVKDKIELRKKEWPDTKSIRLHVRGFYQHQAAYITLVEKDGTSWGRKIDVDTAWKDYNIPLSQLSLTKGVMLPLGYPGRWKYWFAPADGRGGNNDKVNFRNVEWIQLSMRPANLQDSLSQTDSWVELASVMAF